MSKQSETLKLATAIEQIPDLFKVCNKNAAKELRRLHEVNKELYAALEELLIQTKQYGHEPEIAMAEAALKKARGEG